MTIEVATENSIFPLSQKEQTELTKPPAPEKKERKPRVKLSEVERLARRKTREEAAEAPPLDTKAITKACDPLFDLGVTLSKTQEKLTDGEKQALRSAVEVNLQTISPESKVLKWLPLAVLGVVLIGVFLPRFFPAKQSEAAAP
jgi:hypothetical protein